MFGLKRVNGKHIVSEREVKDVEFDTLKEALEYIGLMLYVRGHMRKAPGLI